MGSISDDSLGGLYSDRASKTALKQVRIGTELLAAVQVAKRNSPQLFSFDHLPSKCLTRRQDSYVHADAGEMMHHASASLVLCITAHVITGVCESNAV